MDKTQIEVWDREQRRYLHRQKVIRLERVKNGPLLCNALQAMKLQKPKGARSVECYNAQQDQKARRLPRLKVYKAARSECYMHIKARKQQYNRVIISYKVRSMEGQKAAEQAKRIQGQIATKLESCKASQQRRCILSELYLTTMLDEYIKLKNYKA